MAIGVIKNLTQIGVKKEVTEGTFVPVAAATDFVAPLEDGFDLTPSKELVERTVLTSSLGNPTPRVGMKSVASTLPTELRASGTEGGTPDFDFLLEAALGSVRTIAAQVTTKAAGNTSSVLQIEDADIGDFTVGDFIIVLEAGSHATVFVESVDPSGGTANIGIAPTLSFTPSASVVVSKSRTYFPANSGHPTLSLSYFWGNTILEKAIGTRVTSLSVDGFTTGGVASLNFGLEGLDFDEVDGSSGFTPTFDSALPPIILNACLFQDDTQLEANEFTMSLENTVSFITDMCSSTGRISSRITDRAVTGTFNPYKDDTSVAQFTKFNLNTSYSLIISAYNPSAVAGEITLGSAFGIYLPNVISVEKVVADQEGVNIENISYQATRGDDGATDEIFIGLV